MAFIGVRETDSLVKLADMRLATLEGIALERLVYVLYQERSARGISDFPLTGFVRGWWDRSGTEIDLVAINEEQRSLRLGSCKRSAERLRTDLSRFDGHIARFLATQPRFADWRIERVAIAPELDEESRRNLSAAGYLAQDLHDLTQGL